MYMCVWSLMHPSALCVHVGKFDARFAIRGYMLESGRNQGVCLRVHAHVSACAAAHVVGIWGAYLRVHVCAKSQCQQV
jgi:hypothetical protein